jgi:hypothetical protein
MTPPRAHQFYLKKAKAKQNKKKSHKHTSKLPLPPLTQKKKLRKPNK